jgi:hypothetical protein
MASLAVGDVLALHQMVAAYGHIVDAREWGRLGELFTDDLVFVPWQEGVAPTSSLAELVDRWSSPDFPHPSGHHGTNVVVQPDDDGTVLVTWKGIAVHHDGRCRSFVYYERVRRTAEGWRGFWRRVALQPTVVDPVVARAGLTGSA